MRHAWSKEDIRIVFATCRANTDKKERLRILHLYFPDCSKGSLSFQIIRFQKRNDGTRRWDPSNNEFEGFGSNGKLHDEVWNERDWRII